MQSGDYEYAKAVKKGNVLSLRVKKVVVLPASSADDARSSTFSKISWVPRTNSILQQVIREEHVQHDDRQFEMQRTTLKFRRIAEEENFEKHAAIKYMNKAKVFCKLVFAIGLLAACAEYMARGLTLVFWIVFEVFLTMYSTGILYIISKQQNVWTRRMSSILAATYFIIHGGISLFYSLERALYFSPYVTCIVSAFSVTIKTKFIKFLQTTAVVFTIIMILPIYVPFPNVADTFLYWTYFWILYVDCLAASRFLEVSERRTYISHRKMTQLQHDTSVQKEAWLKIMDSLYTRDFASYLQQHPSARLCRSHSANMPFVAIKIRPSPKTPANSDFAVLDAVADIVRGMEEKAVTYNLQRVCSSGLEYVFIAGHDGQSMQEAMRAAATLSSWVWDCVKDVSSSRRCQLDVGIGMCVGACELFVMQTNKKTFNITGPGLSSVRKLVRQSLEQNCIIKDASFVHHSNNATPEAPRTPQRALSDVGNPSTISPSPQITKLTLTTINFKRFKASFTKIEDLQPPANMPINKPVVENNQQIDIKDDDLKCVLSPVTENDGIWKDDEVDSDLMRQQNQQTQSQSSEFMDAYLTKGDRIKYAKIQCVLLSFTVVTCGIAEAAVTTELFRQSLIQSGWSVFLRFGIVCPVICSLTLAYVLGLQHDCDADEEEGRQQRHSRMWVRGVPMACIFVYWAFCYINTGIMIVRSLEQDFSYYVFSLAEQEIYFVLILGSSCPVASERFTERLMFASIGLNVMISACILFFANHIAEFSVVTVVERLLSSIYFYMASKHIRKTLSEEMLLFVKQSNAIAELEAERKKAELFLLSMYPQDVLDAVRNGSVTKSDIIPVACVVVVDIASFHKKTSHITPEKRTSMLDDIMFAVEAIARTWDAEVCRIVDDQCMLLCKGDVSRKGPCADRAIQLGLEVQFILDQLCEMREWNVRLCAKVGISRGRVSGGMLGRGNPAYDVWGHTVETARRLQKLSKEGQVAVDSCMMNECKKSLIFKFERLQADGEDFYTVFRHVASWEFFVEQEGLLAVEES
eukprot:TRINITY_DN5280_c0_g1_i16.p1 TRINITY_DN5280_c0_g1~~TRINITY_DN5280_c0_g1_i16.p1  ORF type:complete len:1034 (+),score=221.50 TRINITY_DN5280_c0_g1_i16:54-3155(+)